MGSQGKTDMKKRILLTLTAALLTGCSAGDFWKVSKKEIKRSSDEETKAEETTAETSTLPPAEPVVDAHTRHIDITRQKNALYWKRTSHISEYKMRGFGTIREVDDSIYLVLSVSEKNLLVAPEIEGGKASIACEIDDVRLLYPLMMISSGSAFTISLPVRISLLKTIPIRKIIPIIRCAFPATISYCIQMIILLRIISAISGLILTTIKWKTMVLFTFHVKETLPLPDFHRMEKRLRRSLPLSRRTDFIIIP